MTVIKQKAVCSEGHAKSLRNYVNNPKALLRAFQNVRSPKRWAYEMDQVRRRFGHDSASRDGAKNTIMYHQILAFLPDECDVNGGSMTPEMCMRYAEEYARERYPYQQIAFALHKEHCRADKTDRYAVHMAINRSDISTGRRLDEGRGAKAKRERAAFVRQIDERWGLKQLEKDAPNSKVHARQYDRIGAEKEIVERARRRGIDPLDASYKHNLRELCRVLKRRATSMEEYRKMLDKYGVDSEIRGGKLYVTDRDNAKFSFNTARLDRELSKNALEALFRRNAGDAGMAEIEQALQQRGESFADYAKMKEEYLKTISSLYAAYRDGLKTEEAGSGEVQKFKVPRTPEILAKDAEVRQQVLSYARRADELRSRVAGTVGKANRLPSAGNDASTQTRQQEKQREDKNREIR